MIGKPVDSTHLLSLFLFSLLDAGQAEAFSSLTQHLRTVWICPHCQNSLVVNMAERLAHQGQCEIVQQQQKREI